MVAKLRKFTPALVLVAFLLATPSAALGFDGEVGDAGDTTSITDVFVSGSRATVDAQYVRDCPGLISDCWIEVRFHHKCPEVWCGWNAQSWRRLNSSGVAQADCTGASNDDNLWRVEYRLGWIASSTKTVEFWGENEGYVNLSGTFVYRVIAEVLFNVTNSTGTRYGTKITTATGTSAYSSPVEMATSGGLVLVTC